MKWFRIISYLFVGIITMVSCSFLETDVVPEVLLNEYKILLDVSSELHTKVSVDGYSVSWEAGDKIALNAICSDGEGCGESELTVYEIDASDKSKASFSGFVTMKGAPQHCVFTYPLGQAVQVDTTSRNITFLFGQQTGVHAPFMYASAQYNPDGITAKMNYIGTMLEITLAESLAGVKTITFHGNSQESIYPIVVNPETKKFHVPDNVKGTEITVNVQSDGPTYICVPPVNLSNGFSLICTKEDGTRMIRSFSSDGKPGSGYDFSTRIGHKIQIALDGTFTPFSITCSEAEVEHVKQNGLLTGTEATFVMSKSGIPDKLIEEWGATILDSKGMLVREIVFPSTTAITGAKVKMEVRNELPLLPEGKYQFTPYYKSYGQRVSLGTQEVIVDAHGAFVKIEGTTSYDKYLAKELEGANAHTWNIIQDVKVTTNIDPTIISSYTASVYKDATEIVSDKNKENFNGGTANYGNLTMTDIGAYTLTASIKCGSLEIKSDDDVCHITGLPYETDFKNGLPAGWYVLGDASPTDSRITYQGKSTLAGRDGNGAAVSRRFYIPNKSLNIVTFVDACCKDEGVRVYLSAVSANERNLNDGTSVIVPHLIDWNSSLKSKGYIEDGANLVIDNEHPSIMYAIKDVPRTYNAALYKAKILYR